MPRPTLALPHHSPLHATPHPCLSRLQTSLPVLPLAAPRTPPSIFPLPSGCESYGLARLWVEFFPFRTGCRLFDGKICVLCYVGFCFGFFLFCLALLHFSCWVLLSWFPSSHSPFPFSLHSFVPFLFGPVAVLLNAQAPWAPFLGGTPQWICAMGRFFSTSAPLFFQSVQRFAPLLYLSGMRTRFF